VLGNRGARDVEVSSDLASGKLLLPHDSEDLPAARFGDSPKRGVHSGFI